MPDTADNEAPLPPALKQVVEGSDVPARVRGPRKKAGPPAVEEVLAQPKCPDGHVVTADMRFCPECGARIPDPGAPPVCVNGHEVAVDAKFCPSCGVSMTAQVVGQAAPKPVSALTPEELAARQQAHELAVRLGKENPVSVFLPGQAPEGTKTVVIHFLTDGLSAFGTVWFRGQEIELWEGHPRWKEAQSWIGMDTTAQFKRWGQQRFGHGPWPGERSYTAGAGKFQHLKALGDDGGEASPPTEEELTRADEAERRRGRKVPVPPPGF